MAETRAFICPHCEKASAATVRGTAVWSGLDRNGNMDGLPAEWALVQCEHCEIPSVQVREDFGGGFDDDDPVVVYPPPHRISTDVPSALRREWDEARRCFDSKAYTACLVMVRRTLEGTCEELGVKARTLEKSLEKLETDGLIDPTLAEWAKVLRIAGNRGAHYTGDAVSREDAEDAMAFAEALLDHIYVLRKRFTEFQTRINSQS